MVIEAAVGTILPHGNVAHIRRNLKACGLGWKDYYEIPLYGGGVVWVFDSEAAKKLPRWRRKPFLPSSPDGKTGHGVYRITALMLCHLLDKRWISASPTSPMPCGQESAIHDASDRSARREKR